ncbi:unnamed protein product [Dicrocoelium dendriticum]|nr:unnamed protein product [Dicrocoelium dendriticum]
MQLGLETNLDELGHAIENWKTADPRLFSVCLCKLAQNGAGYPPDQLSRLLRALEHKMPLISVDMCRELVKSFNVPTSWIQLPSPILEDVIRLLIGLSIQFSELTGEVCDICAQVVLLQTNPNIQQITSYLDTSAAFVSALLTAAPHSEALLVQQLCNKFPGWRKQMRDILLALFGILHIISDSQSASYFSASSKCALVRIVCKLIVDFNLSLDESFPQKENKSIELCLPGDVEDAEKRRKFMHEILETQTGDDGKILRKLELTTWLMMVYIKPICFSPASKLDWPLLCSIFKCMRDFFSQYVLPVKFSFPSLALLCLYTASLRRGLMINWTESLWTTIKDEQQDCETRISALAYLTCFLAHTRACILDLVVEILHDMAAWCIDYVYRCRNVLLVNCEQSFVTANQVYYAVCDSLLYILVQLHATLLDSPHYRSSCNRLPLAQIRLSPLHPWQHLPDSLRWGFSRVASAYRLSCVPIGLDLVNWNNDDREFSLQTLEAIQPSRFFCLPLLETSSSILCPIAKALFRTPVIGKAFVESEVHLSGVQLGHLQKSVPHVGIDVSKLSRIINDE